ncbi:hypothetical protein Tco_0272857 [Tanacetum coccineum]
MSNSDESGVTYIEVSSPFEGLSDIESPRANDHEYLELLGMPEEPYVEAALQAPPSPDYMSGPEEPEQAPPSPNYVLGPEHADDEISDPEADPEEDDDEDPEEDPVDYPADGGDDGDDEEGSSEDDDIDIEANDDDDDEEEEHLAPTNSVVVSLPATDQAPSTEETEPFETDESVATPPPHPTYHVTARISILAPVPTPVWSDAKVVRLLVISTPPSLPPSPWSSPLPQIPFPSLPLSPPLPVLSPAPPPSPIHAPSLGIPPPFPISVPTSSPPLLLPSASRKEDRPEVTIPPQKRLGIALGPGYEVRESSFAAARPVGGLRADYGFIATMDREIRRDSKRQVGYRITDSVRQDMDEIYTRLDDEQSQRQLLAGLLNMLRRSIDVSDLACGEVMSLRTTVLGQMSKIRELHATDRRRHAVISEMLKADHKRSAEMRELRTADHTRQQQLIQTLTMMQDSRDPLEVLYSQSCQRRLVAVHRLDHVMASHFIYSLLSITGLIPASKALVIDQGVTAALATRDANKNGDDSHTSGTGGRRTERVVRECTYQDFMKVLDLEKTKTTQTEKIVSLKRRVKKLEQKKRSITHGLKRLYKVGLITRVESSRDEESLGEDASKQGRINAIDADEDITLVNDQDDADMFDVNTLTGDEVLAEQEVAAKDVNLTIDEVTLAQALAALKSVKPKVKDNVAEEPSVPVSAASTKVSATTTTTTATIPTLRKGIVITELEEPVKPKKKDLIRLDEEIASKLQAEFNKEERLAREKDEANVALTEEWDDIQAKVDVDYQLAQRLQA